VETLKLVVSDVLVFMEVEQRIDFSLPQLDKTLWLSSKTKVSFHSVIVLEIICISAG